MKVVWALLCNGISIDRETNNISLFNVIEQVKATTVFATADQAGAPSETTTDLLHVVSALSMRFVTLWARTDPDTPESGEGRPKLVLPSGEAAMTNSYKIDLTKFKRTRVISNLPGFPSRGSGQYVLAVEWEQAKGDWQTLFELPIEVDVEESPDE